MRRDHHKPPGVRRPKGPALSQRIRLRPLKLADSMSVGVTFGNDSVEVDTDILASEVGLKPKLEDESQAARRLHPGRESGRFGSRLIFRRAGIRALLSWMIAVLTRMRGAPIGLLAPAEDCACAGEDAAGRPACRSVHLFY
jgi:hypothetical protein